jgi:hypothetical protein
MLAAFTEEALHDEAVRSFARKVSLVTYAEHADLLEESPAKVTLTLKDGRKIERSKYYPTGSVQVPMSPAQIKAKFHICGAQAIDNSAAEKIYVILNTIGEQPSFAELWPLLQSQPDPFSPVVPAKVPAEYKTGLPAEERCYDRSAGTTERRQCSAGTLLESIVDMLSDSTSLLMTAVGLGRVKNSSVRRAIDTAPRRATSISDNSSEP